MDGLLLLVLAVGEVEAVDVEVPLRAGVGAERVGGGRAEEGFSWFRDGLFGGGEGDLTGVLFSVGFVTSGFEGKGRGLERVLVAEVLG